MPDLERQQNATVGYLAEFDFIREGMRQDQRERQGFLGFALAASGLILGLLMRSPPARSATQTCFLVALAAGVTLVAERLTIRASQGVASAGAYLRIFVEPHVEGLEYQRRNQLYIKKVKGMVSASLGFGYAYVALTVAFVAAWLVAPIKHEQHVGRDTWQTIFIAVLALWSLYQAGHLLVASRQGWSSVENAWEEVRAEEPERAAAAGPEGSHAPG